ncbi:MAG: hypothetical protein KGQ41_00605 [Alphaproteobacteria bacterium]|nr:hypothetical protein [Alphaproteobacteria bacterium]
MLKHAQKGNVLFIILIAVVLFAALTYALSSSNRGNTTMDRERGSISATDYLSYGQSMEKIVARMLSNDISENGLSFENTIWKFYDGTDVMGANANCTSSACKIFDPAGGGQEPKLFAAQTVASPANTDVQSGHGVVYALKVTGVGTTAHDLVMMIAILDKNTCMQINNTLGVTNPSNAPPADSWSGATRYTGAFTGPNDATDEIGDVATAIQRKTAGCITRSGGAYGSADNYYYQVLYAR